MNDPNTDVNYMRSLSLEAYSRILNPSAGRRTEGGVQIILVQIRAKISNPRLATILKKYRVRNHSKYVVPIFISYHRLILSSFHIV